MHLWYKPPGSYCYLEVLSTFGIRLKGGGGETPHMKGMGMLVGNFELNH